MKTSELFDNGSLAEASYADLRGVTAQGQLENKLKANEFSPAQAAEFIKHWKVAHHQINTAAGYSATLFESLDNTNEYTFAIRGTELGWDDLIVADGGDIMLDGLAHVQIVDMYNDWLRITTPAGESYQAAVFVELVEETRLLTLERKLLPFGITGLYESGLRKRNNVVIDYPSGAVRMLPFVDSKTHFSDERAVGAGAFPGGASVSVTGHSLGGHLAVAKAVEFGFINSAAGHLETRTESRKAA